MAKINGEKDLPEWFVLKEYRDCASFKAIDWMTALKSRALILELISAGDTDSSRELAEELRKDPVGGWESPPELPVKPLSFADIAFKGGMALMLSSVFPKEAEQWAKTVNMIAAGSLLPDSSMSTPIQRCDDKSHALFVNLHANDSVLIEAFAGWLKAARAQQSTSIGKRERPAYMNWARYGLLPYLDLLIWSRETGGRIPHHVMAQAVGYCKGGDSFRKTVPKLADELMRSLAELEALAAIEARPEQFSI